MKTGPQTLLRSHPRTWRASNLRLPSISAPKPGRRTQFRDGPPEILRPWLAQHQAVAIPAQGAHEAQHPAHEAAPVLLLLRRQAPHGAPLRLGAAPGGGDGRQEGRQARQQHGPGEVGARVPPALQLAQHVAQEAGLLQACESGGRRGFMDMDVLMIHTHIMVSSMFTYDSYDHSKMICVIISYTIVSPSVCSAYSCPTPYDSSQVHGSASAFTQGTLEDGKPVLRADLGL